jgi:exodeoxyribonuclease VII large subunit
MKRRARNVQITLVPALVQGTGAATSLCEAFVKAGKLTPDVIIIGRGGGSMEDLWSFNDENLARLIAASEIPVISAVGHEVDFTICDFVADLRAPTPSAAAELVAKSSAEISQRLIRLDESLESQIKRTLHLMMQKLTLTARRLVDPKKKLQDYAFRNDELLTRLEQGMRAYLSHQSKDVQLLKQRMVSPVDVLKTLSGRMERAQLKLAGAMSLQLKVLGHRLSQNDSLIKSLSPLTVVDRGYSIVSKEKVLVKSVKQLRVSDSVEIQLTDGVIEAEIKKIKLRSGDGL